MEIIAVIIAGIVISLLGKWWLPPVGRDDIGVVTTVVCGVVGVVVGWYAAVGLGIATGGADFARWTLAIVVGSVSAAAVATLTGRSLAGRL
jgi:uncharacterized membrane protein YeaQ/YmgE (transglycosylase-associated protein family)